MLKKKKKEKKESLFEQDGHMVSSFCGFVVGVNMLERPPAHASHDPK